mgnify:CR=1 FL=1
MKKFFSRIFLAVCVVAGGLLISKPADAQLLFGISFDAKGDVKSTIQQVEQYLATVQEEVVAEVKKALTAVKSTADKLKGSITKLVSKIPGTKDFDVASSVDVYDYEAVKTAFNELFLQYPSTEPRIKKAYEQKAEQFYYDTLVEVKTALAELETQLGKYRKEVEAFSEEALTSDGSGSTANSEEENGVDYNVYMAARKMNDILKITEELVAMRNQYFAASMMHGGRQVLPAEKVEAKETPAMQTSELSESVSIMFGQFMSQSAVPSSGTTGEPDTEEKTSSTGKSSDRFVVPAAPATSAPLEGSESELEALKSIARTQEIVNSALDVHNMLQRMPEYKAMYKQYSLYKKLHERAVEAVKEADVCVTRYLGRRYANPNNVWFGQVNIPANTCDYNSRKGLSQWAITAYQSANDDAGNAIDVNSFSNYDIDTETDSQTLVEPDTESLEKKNAEEPVDESYVKPSHDQEYSNSVREVELLNWIIGRKAAMVLVEDQYSPKPAYGKADHPFPIWNDQRSYYDQYIGGKYESIKAYLRELDFTNVALNIAQILNSGQEESEDKDNTATALGKLETAMAEMEPPVKATSRLLEEKTKALADIRQKEASELAPYLKNKESLNEKLDAWTEAIVEVTEEINGLNQQASYNKSRAESANNQIKLMDSRGTPAESSLYIEAKDTFANATESHAENIEELGEKRITLKKYEAERDKIQAALDKLNTQIEEIQSKYQHEIIAIESDYDAQMIALQKNPDIAPQLSTIAQSVDIIDSGALGFIGKADSLINTARTCAIQFVEDHENDLSQMKGDDSLYLSTHNGNVVQKHSDMINKIIALPGNCFEKEVAATIGSLSVSPQSIIPLLQGLFTESLTKICSEYTCDAGDTQYFVGLPAKPRDFTAPRAALVTHYPPVRDMVHLDTTDYKHLDVSKDGRLNRNAFLEYGLEQPYIWQLLLSDKAFIERGVDLETVLEKGGEGKAFARGEQLPCRTGNYMIDMSNNGKYSVVDIKKNPSAGNLQRFKTLYECRDLRITGQTPGIGNVLNTFIVYDSAVEKKKDRTTLGNAAGSISDPNTSELGMFLRYNDGVLSVNKLPYYGYTMLIKKEKDAEKDGKYKINADDNIYQRSMFANNQIGDFLHFVDKELEVKKNLDEIEANLANLKSSITELFDKINFKLKDDIDFSSESDFNYVTKKLEEEKNTLMSRISSSMGSINHGNETVNERYQRLNNTYKVLLQDNKYKVNLTTNTQAGSSLSESIKTAETNEKVIEKSRKEGYDSIQEQIDDYERPVCMPY